MAMELENWICDMANGDKEGLRQFYEETARSVYSFIFSVLKDPHESEDVMQEMRSSDSNLLVSHPDGQPCLKPSCLLYTTQPENYQVRAAFTSPITGSK